MLISNTKTSKAQGEGVQKERERSVYTSTTIRTKKKEGSQPRYRLLRHWYPTNPAKHTHSIPIRVVYRNQPLQLFLPAATRSVTVTFFVFQALDNTHQEGRAMAVSLNSLDGAISSRVEFNSATCVFEGNVERSASPIKHNELGMNDFVSSDCHKLIGSVTI